MINKKEKAFILLSWNSFHQMLYHYLSIWKTATIFDSVYILLHLWILPLLSKINLYSHFPSVHGAQWIHNRPQVYYIILHFNFSLWMPVSFCFSRAESSYFSKLFSKIPAQNLTYSIYLVNICQKKCLEPVSRQKKKDYSQGMN